MGKFLFKRNHAFTLLEILIVIIIISILAAIAMPSYSLHVERVKATEGVGLLTVLLAAQERYRLENNAYATAIGSLDIDVPNSANFNLPPNLYNAAARVATLSRSDGTYTLCINSTGVVSCSGAANICSAYAAGGAGICP
ncbi:MAG: prepilin-type N-terminal cleavage/methylation domain-containing protein [Candidatus Omnitrophica bacterium]|nr:prepilin-type N-terminal cleavage/methylation domain-containing protein [Candidatus Omnitrophota bacterium]